MKNGFSSDVRSQMALSTKLALMKRYLVYGRTKELYAAADGICTEHTLRNWLNDPVQAANSPLVKNGALDKIIERLYTAEPVDYLQNYRFSLSEMRVKEESQVEVKRYLGNYAVFSNIPSNKVAIERIKIRVNQPFMPLFNLRASVEGLYRHCDGFMFHSGSRLFLTGLAEYINAFLVLVPVVNPTRDVIKGVMTLEDRMGHQCFISSVALVRVNSPQLSLAAKKVDSLYAVV